MKLTKTRIMLAAGLLLAACQEPVSEPGSPQATTHRNGLIDLWGQEKATFGVYVPNEDPLTREERQSGLRRAPSYSREGGAKLARNPLYDFVFLNLEGNYDTEAVTAIAQGCAVLRLWAARRFWSGSLPFRGTVRNWPGQG